MLYRFNALALLPAQGLDVAYLPDTAAAAVYSDLHASPIPTRGEVDVVHTTETTEAGVLHLVEVTARLCPKAAHWQPPSCVSHVQLASVDGSLWVCGSTAAPMVQLATEATPQGRLLHCRYKGPWPLARVLPFD